MSTKKATAEIMAIFEKMYEEGEEVEETYDAIAEGGVKAGSSKKQKLAHTPTESNELLTTDEAVDLALAASQYYVNKNTDGDFDGLARAGGFAKIIYKKARDELKPQYKEDFDVKAIAKVFNKLANEAWG